jgi:hypothetical protein
VSNVAAVFYVTDLRHFEGIESDPDAPGPALALARYLRRIVRVATALSEPGPHATGVPCRQHPQRRRCPGHLRVELQHVPAQIQWACSACGEAGVIDGWQATADDLSSVTRSSAPEDHRTVTLTDAAYRLLLDEPSMYPRCTLMVYGAAPQADGVTLSGTEEELQALIEMATARAAQGTGLAAKRHWRQLAADLEPRGRTWLEHGTDVVAAEFEQLGLVASRAKVTEMVRRSLAIVASEMGISQRSAQRYVEDEALRELARQAAIELADEQPGADLHEQARTIPMSLQLVGRAIAGLAESAHVRILNADDIGAHGTLQLLSLVGQILHESPNPEPGLVLLPQGALTRAARLLEATATIVIDGGVISPDLPDGAKVALAEAFLDDAQALRTLVSEHGTSPGPPPSS